MLHVILFTVKNQWKHLTVGNMSIGKDLNSSTVNGYNLQDKFNSTVFKSDMTFKNINFTNTSGIKIYKIFENLFIHFYMCEQQNIIYFKYHIYYSIIT